MNSDESDNDLLENLLATANDDIDDNHKDESIDKSDEQCPVKVTATTKLNNLPEKLNKKSSNKNIEEPPSQTKSSENPNSCPEKTLNNEPDTVSNKRPADNHKEGPPKVPFVKPLPKPLNAKSFYARKELEFDFMDLVEFAHEFEEDGFIPDKKFPNNSESIKPESSHQNTANSSDEEDEKYFEAQRYSEYGREIKNMLKEKDTEKSFSLNFKQDSPTNTPCSSNITKKQLSTSFKSKPITSSYSATNEATSSKISDKYSLKVNSSSQGPIQQDVYSDPIFGLRLIRPQISSTELVEKMKGRKAVNVSDVKLHLANTASCGEEDWVIGGVLLSKTAPKTSQKGNQYCIWKITDLSNEMRTVSVFLFKSAYKQFWKLSVGAVMCMLNPSVMECRDDKDLATLSVDSAQRIIIMGVSKELGKCKSMKKNGDPCLAPINIKFGDHCIYHVKQEYGKFSRRSELQNKTLARSLDGPKGNLGNVGNQKPNSFSQQRHPEAAPFIAIKAVRNEAQHKKDLERLAALKGNSQASQKPITRVKLEPASKAKTSFVELCSNQAKKDLERLAKLKQSVEKNPVALQKEKIVQTKFNLPVPKLGSGIRNGIIDFSQTIPTSAINNAKLNAIEWVKKNGTIKKENPNKIRPSKEDLAKSLKRKREEIEEKNESELELAVEKKQAKSRFKEMLEMKSSHSDLIQKREDEDTENYFRKLEVKEQMEEKMLSTYKVDCKAVSCNVCKYTAFSSSEMCKKLRHSVKVVDAVKRFFKCTDCGNRTITLDRIPTETCKRCSSSKWIKTAMMDEKRTEVKTGKLCIRGGEEKYIGSMGTDASLDMLVPETDA